MSGYALYCLYGWELLFVGTFGPLWGFIVGYWVIPRLFPTEKHNIIQNVTNASCNTHDHSGYLVLEEKICSWKNALLRKGRLSVILSFCLNFLVRDIQRAMCKLAFRSRIKAFHSKTKKCVCVGSYGDGK